MNFTTDTYSRLQSDIREAMTDGNSTKRDCLRSIVSDIKNATVNEGKEITEEACMKALRKSAKQHGDSIESFKAGGREDLALKEAEELAYIENYLPKEPTEEETRKIVEAVLETVECLKKNFGLIMKNLPAEVNRKVAAKILNGLLK